MFPPGPGADGEVIEVREGVEEAIVLVRWEPDPLLYGIPIPFTDTRHEFYYDSFPVSSDDEWLDSVGIGLTVMLGTGHRARARRSRVGDYIELRREGGWSVDHRFYLQDVDSDFELLAERLRSDGLDPSLAIEKRGSGELVCWLLMYENNSSGSPWVGQSVISRVSASECRLDLVEIAPDVPITVSLDLSYYACHSAAVLGARSIQTTLGNEEFTLAGFRPTADGSRVLDTNFLDADPDGARALLEADMSRGSRWSDDRDRNGRYFPNSRMGRVMHRVRYGRSGLAPRTFVKVRDN